MEDKILNMDTFIRNMIPKMNKEDKINLINVLELLNYGYSFKQNFSNDILTFDLILKENVFPISAFKVPFNDIDVKNILNKISIENISVLSVILDLLNNHYHFKTLIVDKNYVTLKLSR